MRECTVPIVSLCVVVVSLCTAEGIGAQVHYHKSGAPWKQRARKGPDAAAGGWYYNLGITGIRAQLVEERPTELLVKYVFPKTPARGKVRPGDFIVGAGQTRFRTPHVNGYGMDKFGPDGPIGDFAEALERSQGRDRRGRLPLLVRREGKIHKVELDVGTRYGRFAKTYPAECEKSDRILKELLDFLVEQQRPDGSWGSPPHDTFAPLALLASSDPRHRKAVERNVKMHARTTAATDDSWLINWRYMSAAIVMSEYYLATGKRWVLKELNEVYQFLCSTQYTDLSQLNPKARESHPDSVPKTKLDSHGGWGHNPGFEGYGPISMITGQGALAFALMERCGVKVDRQRHDWAYAFLDRGTGRNGYLWYKDQSAGQQNWADMGRTGAAGIANHLSPYKGGDYRRRALAHAKVIGDHPQSFPDTHGSPIMGMGYTALAANVQPDAFRSLMDANRWWFTLAHCADKSFYYQPNRDNAGYGSDSRVSASAVTALILSIPKRNLCVTGKRSN